MRQLRWVLGGVANKIQAFGVRMAAEMAWDELRYFHRFPSNMLQHAGTSGLALPGPFKGYAPSPYRFLREAFRDPVFDPAESVLVDFGCGTGRALMFASQLPFRRLIGVDRSEPLCRMATDNLTAHTRRRRQASADWRIVQGDSQAFAVPPEANVFFLFDPFPGDVVRAVAENLLRSIEQAPRRITVIYVCPTFKQEFLSLGFQLIRSTTAHRTEYLTIFEAGDS